MLADKAFLAPAQARAAINKTIQKTLGAHN